MRKSVLGVDIDDVSQKEAVEVILSWLKKGGKYFVVTPNPEFIMLAQSDEGFRKVLNAADLAIPDGIGLKRFAGFKNITPGVYLMEELCRVAAEKGFTTGFLGGRDGVAERAAECLQKKYPGLKVAFAEDGPEVNTAGEVMSPAGSPRSPSSVTIPACDILFVGFGQVKQEKWIVKNLEKLPVKVAMGVGGSFDETSGKVPRIPRRVQDLGLKWLFRLILQPWRFKRQLKIWQFAWTLTRKSGTVKINGSGS